MKAMLAGLLDPGITLMGAKKYLATHGFTSGFGNPEVIARFQRFVDAQTAKGTYAGKSIKLHQGGRAAILKHGLIVKGKFGEKLSDISPKDWVEINKISRINFFNKYR